MALPKLGEKRTVTKYVSTDQIRKEIGIGENVSLLLYVPTTVSVIFDIFKVAVVNFLPYTVFGLTLGLYSKFLEIMIERHLDAKGFNISEQYEWNVDPIMGYEDVAKWRSIPSTRKYTAVY
ncbi:hypothetical protein KQI88_05045 [Alkaliphilus sp. MSJ-5]|uniref:Uncharacterized protein n=1 Tax=Alkaliphilus flagellatus TaxID=2841507 RepID=A0ABS6FZU8_9FIRM|nr:hypothetical protein [Alkaliphilus flagellatus]MBU5675775.1 hypothetical protein [Alkaliphilus flagellatus]